MITINCKILTATIIILIFTASCSIFEMVVYRPEINQGNYLTTDDVAKIYIGMTKQQVTYILGTSMLKDPFGSNTCYYIFRSQSRQKSITQQTLTLSFNDKDVLTCIDNKLTLNNHGINQE